MLRDAPDIRSAPLRIFVDPGSYSGANLGDVAMFVASLRKLRSLWPSAEIRVHALSPAPYRDVDAALTTVDSRGASAWSFETWFAGGTIAGSRTAASLIKTMRRFRARAPFMANRFARLLLRLRQHSPQAVDEYLAAVRNADLVVMTGAGGFCDAFRQAALCRLETLDLAIESGAITAVMSHGIGPIHDRALMERARSVLPRVDLISLREGVTAPVLLEQIGVAPERWTVAGDDAVLLAHAARPERHGNAIGVNLRIAAYAGVTVGMADSIGAAVRSVAARRGAPLLPVVIAREGDVDDLRAALRMAGVPALPPADIEDGAAGDRTLSAGLASLLRTIGECRVVVAGSYHAALLALAMGIPVVAICGSDYYAAKFAGLAGHFGPACQIESASTADLAERVAIAVDRAWLAADRLHADLRQASVRQVTLCEAVYARLERLVRLDRRDPPGGSAPAHRILRKL